MSFAFPYYHVEMGFLTKYKLLSRKKSHRIRETVYNYALHNYSKMKSINLLIISEDVIILSMVIKLEKTKMYYIVLHICVRYVIGVSVLLFTFYEFMFKESKVVVRTAS
jgi:hypothetical protein